MHHRPLRRAAVLSFGALLAFAGTAAADTVPADPNPSTTMIEASRDLGDVAPGATVSVDVRFVVTCFNSNHLDAGQSVRLDWSGGGTVPGDGAVLSVTTVTLAPLTTPWPADGELCAGQTQEGGALSRVTLRAPTSLGPHTFTVVWNRSLSPAGNGDAVALSRLTAVDLTLRVVTPPANTPPVLTVPASFTVEGDTTGGWTAAWPGVSATDAEDDPDPAATCTPPAGTLLALDTTTTVSCSVEDDAGATDSDSFTVTVVDTTAPVLSGVPADPSVTADGPAGAAVTFSMPSATDVVDSSPAVACAPASGSTFAVGTTSVTCSATDDKGNTSAAGFDVTVAPFVPEEPPTEEPPTEEPPGEEPPGEEPPTQPTASATWLEPVAASGGTFVANRGRTIPVKVRLFVDGRERRQGDAGLAVTPCGGGSSSYVDLWWGGGRWNYAIDTSRLAGSCYVVKATISDLVAGKFTLDLRGGEAAKARRTPPAPKHVVPRHDKVKHHRWHRPTSAARHGCR